MPRKPLSAPAASTATQAATAPAAGNLTLSPSAQALYDEIAHDWTLTAPVRAMLRLACEAMTKAEQAELISAVEGMTVADQKGSSKPHPAALLARDYRSQAQMALQRILSALER